MSVLSRPFLSCVHFPLFPFSYLPYPVSIPSANRASQCHEQLLIWTKTVPWVRSSTMLSAVVLRSDTMSRPAEPLPRTQKVPWQDQCQHSKKEDWSPVELGCCGIGCVWEREHWQCQACSSTLAAVRGRTVPLSLQVNDTAIQRMGDDHLPRVHGPGT